MTCRFSAILFLMMMALGMNAAAQTNDKSPSRTVRIDGAGSVKAKPDIAQVSLGVAAEAATAREALDQNSASMAKIIEALKQAGLAPEDVQTVDFTVRPRYAPQPKQEEKLQIATYRVVNLVRVTIRDLTRLGEILDKAVSLGSNEIGGIQFNVGETGKLLDEARRRAMEDAKRKAALYAEAAGAALGRVLTIDEQTISPWRPQMLGTRMEAKAAEAPVQAGEAELQVQISVMWELTDSAPKP